MIVVHNRDPTENCKNTLIELTHDKNHHYSFDLKKLVQILFYGIAEMQFDTCGQSTHFVSACRLYPSVRIWAYMSAKG